MSTDRSRLVSSIRRIVLTDPDLSSALDAWQNRGDQASSTGVGTSDAERDRLCCDGSTSDNPNPGADTRDTSEGGQDGLDADDPADIGDMGGGCLSGVTDCATGVPVCFCGDDWIPPEGWDGPQDPPVAEGYTEGYYWITVIDGTVRRSNHPGGFSSYIAAQYPKGTSPYIEYVSDYVTMIDDDNADITVVQAEYESEGGGFLGYSEGVGPDPTREECTGQAVCDDPVPLEDNWDVDGCTNLAIKNGTIVGSKYDPENDGTYSKPMSEIELCDGSGNSFFLSPASTGLFKTIDATKTDGYLYDNNGKKIAHIDGNEYSDPDI